MGVGRPMTINNYSVLMVRSVGMLTGVVAAVIQTQNGP